MASIKQISDKRKSVSSINKITSAMELVSTAKSRKATNELRDYKDFYQKIGDAVTVITSSPEYQPKTEFKGTLWIIFGSDLGLAGGYNNNLFKLIKDSIDKNDKFIIFGSKPNSIMKSKIDNEIIEYDSEYLSKPENLIEVTRKILEMHNVEELKVNAVYTVFLSQISFQESIFQLLPIKKGDVVTNSLMEFEPNANIVISEMMRIYVPTMLKGFMKEALASEHTSRRTAMENATKNGNDLLDDLEKEYNKTRQAKITQEISEISAGSEALK